MSLLVIVPGAIGDLILSLPALATLRGTLGARRMEIWTERANIPLVDHPAYADRVRALADTGLDSYPLPSRTLEAMLEFGTVVSWRGAAREELVSAVRAVHRRAYFLLHLPPPTEAAHLADFRRRQLIEVFGNELGACEALWANPAIPLTEEDTRFAAHYLAGEIAGGRPIVAMHPGASGEWKRWEAANFAALARRLACRWEAEILLTEGPLDAAAVRAVSEVLGGVRIRVVRLENLRQLASVLGRAHLFIGNDTGIAHLAAAVGTPTLAIFMSSDPRLWSPRGMRVEVLERPVPDEAAATTENLLLERCSHAGQPDSRP